MFRGYSLRHALQEQDMTDTDTPKTDWCGYLGRHHPIRVVDDNPEVRGQTVLLCTRCGKHADGPTADGAVGLDRGGRYREVAGRPGQAEAAASVGSGQPGRAAAGGCCTRTHSALCIVTTLPCRW